VLDIVSGFSSSSPLLANLRPVSTSSATPPSYRVSKPTSQPSRKTPTSRANTSTPSPSCAAASTRVRTTHPLSRHYTLTLHSPARLPHSTHERPLRHNPHRTPPRRRARRHLTRASPQGRRHRVVRLPLAPSRISVRVRRRRLPARAMGERRTGQEGKAGCWVCGFSWGAEKLFGE
jgi:hypothetical protein